MSLTEMKLKSNSKIRIDFGGGNLSSDGGLLLIKEFLSKIGFERLAAAKAYGPGGLCSRICRKISAKNREDTDAEPCESDKYEAARFQLK